MPTNLSPQCKLLEAKYFEAKTLPEKIRALEEYHSAIPKHKGTERLRAGIKRKISKLRLEMEKKKQRSTVGQASGRCAVKKEGAAQVVILGSTSSGKSSLLRSLKRCEASLSLKLSTSQRRPG